MHLFLSRISPFSHPDTSFLAAFDYDFNAMEGEDDPLVKSYNDFM